MITFEQARDIALRHIGDDCALVESATRERPYGWYFVGQSKAYIASGDMRHMLVGSGGFVVERDGGRVVEFTSARRLEENLAAYEAGFKYNSYDLIIRRVRLLDETVRLLGKLHLRYVEPEEAYGAVWRIPQPYTPRQLRGALRQLPHTFPDQNLNLDFGVFDEIRASNCCEFEIVPRVP